MIMQKLIKKLNSFDIYIDLIGEKLDIQAPKGAMTEDLLNEIKQHKDELIEFIKTYKSADVSGFDNIPSIAEQDGYLISSSQKRLWVLDQLQNGNTAYNMPSILRIRGKLNLEILEKAFLSIIERHESLRTVFRKQKNEEVRQVILPISDCSFTLEYENLENVVEPSRIDAYVKDKLQYSFDLANDCLLHAKVLQLEKDSFVFVIIMHHIIGDAWSLEIVTKELFTLYDHFLKGKNNPLEPLEIQYKDYAAWQQKTLQEGQFNEDQKYWAKQFDGEIPVLELPTLKARPKVKTYIGNAVKKRFNLDRFKAFERLCNDQGATLFMGLTTIVKVLLYRYTEQNDIIIGTPVAGREHPDLQNQIGFYINTLALRTQFEENDNFKTALSKVKEVILDGQKHQNYPYDEIVEDVVQHRDISRNPLFDIMVSLENLNNLSFSKTKFEELEVEIYENDEEVVSKFDIEFIFQEGENGLNTTLVYNPDIYDSSFVEGFLEHLEVLLISIVDQPDVLITKLALLTKKEEDQLLYDFNNTKVDYPVEKTVIDLFEEQVDRTPDNIAVKFNDISLTYRELNEKSNQLAGYLYNTYSIQSNDVIGIKLERSEQLIVTILGILKSGAAYVPIDIEYPEDRVTYMQQDSKCKLVFDHEELKRFSKVENDYATNNLSRNSSSKDLAYIIYTSGSTGKPKGVMIEHESVSNLIHWFSNIYNISEATNAILLTEVTFDPSVEDIFATLSKGGVLHVITKELLLNIDSLIGFIKVNNISILNYVPKFLHQLLGHVPKIDSIEKVISGGESILDETKNILLSKGYELYNNYGPTETTVDALSYRMTPQKVSIGKPIHNGKAFVLNKSKELMPLGCIGELCISGLGLSRGYLNQEDLTSQKFVTNPFFPEEKMYLTGDLVRWLPDGTIEYIGRKDTQVKIRGYRIELGEIENALTSQSDIDQAVVTVKGNKGDSNLIAYILGEKNLDLENLKVKLSSLLPEYMIPSYYMTIDSIPLTSNGKVDVKALPDIEVKDMIQANYVAPQNQLEEKLVAIWEKVLGIDGIGVTDNFFELGGHSLKVIQFINKTKVTLGKDISIKDVFNRPTIKEIASSLTETTFESIPKSPQDDSYPLTSSQRRLWLLKQLEEETNAYNISNVFEIKGSLDVNKLKEAFNYCINRHESLRTVFKVNEEGEVRQYVITKNIPDFDVLENNQINKLNPNEDIQSLIDNSLSHIFDLEKFPLLRAETIRVTPTRTFLTLNMHHIISDGWSLEVLRKEVMLVYNSLVNEDKITLPPLPIQYIDYSNWVSKEFDKERAYWQNQFDGELPVLELPSLNPRPKLKTNTGKRIQYVFSKEFLEKLNNFSKSRGVTIFTTLMAGINGLFYRYTNNTDIILGTPVAGREHPDLEEQIGLYLNTLAVRTRFNSQANFDELVSIQNNVLIEAYDHQRYPFDTLVENLNISRDTSRSVLFDILVVMQNQSQLFNQDLKLDNLEITPYENDITQSKFDLTFNFIELDKKLQLDLIFNPEIYHTEFVNRLLAHLENFLIQAITNATHKIDELIYLEKQEEQALLEFDKIQAIDNGDDTIVSVFEKQVQESPENIAVVCGNKEVSYEELNENANIVASYLRDFTNDEIVAVELSDRGDLMLTAILGILKSSKAYVLIDKDLPKERIDFIIEDSKCSKMLTESTILQLLKLSDRYCTNNPNPKNSTPKNLVYLIYTSGTTGVPKGVQIKHESVVNYVNWFKNKHNVTSNDKTVITSSLSFDLIYTSLYGGILNGAQIHFLEKTELKDSLKVTRYILENNITFLKITPTYLNLLLTKGLEEDITHSNTLRLILTGGEKQNLHHTERIVNTTNIHLVNHYGPSETTIGVCTYTITKNNLDDYLKKPVIGYPIANTKILILGEEMQLLPIGVIGEICIGGIGLSVGYRNQLELTQAKFINNPFSEGDKLYRTGDLGRRLPNGTVEFIGRKDDQVKIRGYRVEPSEIEKAILNQEGIEEVVITVNEINEEKTLVCYYVSSSNVDKRTLRTSISKLLPDYMLPSYYATLVSIPFTSNGKVDKKALPLVTSEDLVRNEYVAPTNVLEEKIATVWQDVLGVDIVGINDNFFELGGHSLKATKLVNTLNQILNYDLSIKDLFIYPTVAEIVARLKKSTYRKIPIASKKESYSLTPSQHRLWLLSQFDRGNEAYNVSRVFEIEGELNTDILSKAFNVVVSRHESLRTVFKKNETGEVYQHILSEEAVNVDVTIHDVTGNNYNRESINELIEERLGHSFDLAKAPLLKTEVINLSPNRSILIFIVHHIISDGWSMEVLSKELVLNYNSLINGEEAILPELSIQYKDYSEWLVGGEKQKHLEKEEEFWLNQFNDELPVLELPSFKSRPTIKTYNGNSIDYKFSSQFAKTLNKYAKEQGLTTFMTLMAGINGLFYRYTGNTDIILGTPVAGREHADLENQVGLYLNTLAIRTKFDRTVSFKGLTNTLKTNLLNAYENQNYPFDGLVNKLDIRRDTSRSALFDVLVVLQNQQELLNSNIGSFKDLELKPITSVDSSTSRFDISFSFIANEENAEVRIEYNTDIYEEEFINTMVNHLETFLLNSVSNPEIPIKSINYISLVEQDEILKNSNSITINEHIDKTVINLFIDQVKRTPEKIAVVFENKEITYKELDEVSNQLSNYLLSKCDIESEDLIGVKIERSEWLIIALLASLKTGAAYLPIDPNYPKQRIAYIENDSNCKAIVDQEFLETFLREKNTSKTYPDRFIKAQNLAYVIYTSGSTGRPKGVMIEHRSLVSFISNFQDNFKMGGLSNLAATTNYTFDISFLELIGGLCVGKKVSVFNSKEVLDPVGFIKRLDLNHIEVLQLTPSRLHQILEYKEELSSKLKTLIVGGEPLSNELKERVLQHNPHLELINVYGPTETTIWSTFHTEKLSEKVCIGSSLINEHIYVLSDSLDIQPVGVIGELCISGDGLARGYLNQDELTNEKFVTNPYITRSRLYKTGDLARWLPDGSIDFIGRKDDQVKIRGHRIELGEIENALIAQKEIEQAIVLVKEQESSKNLVAYIVGKDSVDKHKVRQELVEELPSYMLPSYIVVLDSIPLTTNGKVDKKNLPNVSDDDIIKKEYVAPKNDIEKKLVTIWEEVLEVKKIGVTDIFFELGGDSLKVTIVSNRIKQVLQLEVNVKDIFLKPTIADIALKLEKNDGYREIEKAIISQDYALTSSQKRLWLLSQFEGGNEAYNISEVFVLKGVLDFIKLKNAFKFLMSRHESLRTVFRKNNEGEIRQIVLPETEISFDIDVKELEDGFDIQSVIEKSLSHSFDLDKGPLLKAEILRLSDNESLLICNIHHIISDGWSMELLSNEVIQIYNALVNDEEIRLPELRIQYKDYSEWTQQEFYQEKINEEEQYWLDKFAGELPILELPSFNSRPQIKTYNGNGITHKFSLELSQQIAAFSEKHGATLFMTLMAGINGLFSRYTNTNDIILGTPVAGRGDRDLENQVGLFLNTLAIRTQFDQKTTFKELVLKQKETLLEAYSYQNYPFDTLVEKLNLKRDTSRSALFDVMVVFQNQQSLLRSDKLVLDSIEVEPYKNFSKPVSQFDLSFSFSEAIDGLELQLAYNSDIYQKQFIERMVAHLGNFLQSGISNELEALSQLAYLEKHETYELLEEYNDTSLDYDVNKTIVDLFEEQVSRTPNEIVIVVETREFTYAQINERSNKLANYLRDTYKLQPEDLIGVKLERNEELLITILAVLKSGAAYVPIDIKYPVDRIKYIEQDSNCKVIVDTYELNQFAEVSQKYSGDNLDKINSTSDLAYIIYTSGSTGKPKGVMIEHRNAVAMLKWAIREFEHTNFDIIYAVTSHCFDLSVFEMFYPLVIGKKIRMIESGLAIPEYISDDSRILINTVPSVIQSLLKKQVVFDNVVAINMAGEPIPIELSNAVNELDIEIRNLYGPSEDTTYSSCFKIERTFDKSIPIGKPIDNTQFYILSEDMTLQPHGVIGEIYISGKGLSRGYLNSEHLTSEKFISNPFIKDTRLYKTGDLGRWLPDGEIEFFGRKDNQVKIRGYRIELGEIEKAITSQDIVEQATVIIKREEIDASIIAYLVAPETLDKQNLRFRLNNILPDYMLPNYFVIVDKIPLTPNGKVDKSALPAVTEKDVIKREYIAPRTDLEEDLVTIWKEILEIEKIGVTDNFFELGGHSISATKLLSVVYQRFNVKIEIEQVFVNPTIEYLAVNIENTNWLEESEINQPVKKIII